MKIFQASRNLAHVTAQFSAAGLNIEDFLAADETALKAHLESLTAAFPVNIDPVAPAAAAKEVSDLRAANATLASQLSTLSSALSAQGLDPADLAKSFTDRVALKAAELTATQGIPSAVQGAVGNTPVASTPAPKSSATGYARVRDFFAAKSAK